MLYLNGGGMREVILLSGDIWQRLETFLVVTTGKMILASSAWRPGCFYTFYKAQDRLHTIII